MIGKILVASCDFWKRVKVGEPMVFFNEDDYKKALKEKWIEFVEYVETRSMITNKAIGVPRDLMKKLGWKDDELLIAYVEEHKSKRKMLKVVPFLKDPDKPFG